MIDALLKACHDDPMCGGHFSLDRTYHKLKAHYSWPNMIDSIKQYIKSCSLCQQYNVSRQKKPGRLRSVPPPDGPFQAIGIDYCGPLPRTPSENRYVLVITDYFTRHVVAISLPNCSATTTAAALFNEYFCRFGVPCMIISDQGSHFCNQLMTNMSSLIGYNHIFSTAYHPQTNGIVERFNSTFIQQISKLQDSEHKIGMNIYKQLSLPIIQAFIKPLNIRLTNYFMDVLHVFLCIHPPLIFHFLRHVTISNNSRKH